MSLYSDENVITKYFIDNWTHTKVSYDGVPFSVPTANEWISLALVPYRRELYAIAPQHGRKKDYASIEIRCFAGSPTLVKKLCEIVLNFLECKTLTANDGKEILISIGEPSDLGAENLENGTFMFPLSFDTVKYN